MRSLGRASALTRGIGLLVAIGALLGMFMALFGSTSSSDRMGFTLISLAVLLFATLVWANGVFHGAVGRALPTLIALDEKVARLEAVLAARAVPSAAEGAGSDSRDTIENVEPAPESAPRPAPRAVPPEPERVPCPLCGGLIHPEASRCVHCMKKLPRRDTA